MRSPRNLLKSGTSLAMARDTVLADCSCSRTPGTSLAAALCSVSCSRTPGTSLAMARDTVLADCSCSCTAWFVRALRLCTVSDDCSNLLFTGSARLCACRRALVCFFVGVVPSDCGFILTLCAHYQRRVDDNVVEITNVSRIY